MNFPKLMVLVAIAVVAIGSIMYFTRTDRSDPLRSRGRSPRR
jgi:hypothetical protein